MGAESRLSVPCPSCGRRTVYGPDNPWRPFCSERCRNQDLGAWASERFRISGDAPTEPPLLPERSTRPDVD